MQKAIKHNNNLLKTNCLTILFLIFYVTLNGQERKPVSGKIISTYDELEGIYVINKTAELTVATSKGGYFTIPAAINDTLVVTAIQFVARQVVVQPENMQGNLMFVKLEFMVRDLDEVTINQYKNLTSEALGLAPKGQKRYTPAERKLATAGDMAMNPMGLDPLINWMSGRTRMLKTGVQIEKKEKLMEKINYVYDEEKLINEFKIPAEYVKGFIYYIADDPEFAAAIKAKNDGMARFLISGLSVKYLKIIADDK